MRRFFLLLVGGLVVLLPSAPLAQAQKENKAEPSLPKDAFGDPLPVGAIARIGTTRYRLSDSHVPHSAAMSPDGKLLAILRLPDELEIWELATWKRHCLIRCRKFDKASQLVAPQRLFSADSKKLVMFDSVSKQVEFLDVDSGNVTKQIDLSEVRGKNEGFPRLQLSRDQQTLIITSNMIGPVGRERIRVWDLAKDKMVQSFYVMTSRYDAGFAISPDCRRLAQNTAEYGPSNLREDGTYSIRVYDLLPGELSRSLETEIPMDNLALSPDGKWLVACYGSFLRIFDDAGKERHNIRTKPSMRPMSFSPDGKFLFLADYTGNIQKWDPASGERVATYSAPYRCSISQLAFQPDGKVMALGISAYTIHLWDIAAGKVIPATGVPASVITDLIFSPEGELLVASGEGMLAGWNPQTGVKLRDLKMESSRSDNFVDHRYYGMGWDLLYHRRDASSFTFSRSGDFLANHNHLYEMKSGKLLWPIQGDFPFGPIDEAGAMGFLDGESNVVSVLQKKVRIWDIRTGRDILNFNVPLREKEKVVMLRMSSDGKHFAFGTVRDRKYFNGAVTNPGNLGVRLWSAREKKFVREWTSFKHQEVMEFSPDSRWLAFARENGRVQLTRAGSTNEEFDVQLGNESKKITQIAFSPDSRQLACAAIAAVTDREVGRIFIVEMVSKKIRLEVVGHTTGIIERLAYSRDSALLASGATDTTALVWNAGLRAFAAKSADKDATAKELVEWFQQMAGRDAKQAFQSMIKLTQTPTQVVKLLEEKIPPAKKDDKVVNEVLHARAVEVLEAIASAEARAVLTSWTTGDPTAVLTVEARQALARLSKLPS
jgi:WD40 repeat protein